MFTNPFNRKYQTGGSAPTDDQKKDMQGFVTWIKSNVEGFKDKSEQEIAKSLSDMAKSDEGKKSVQDLYSRYQKSKKQKSKFADGGKFQDFICKHGRGGNVDCGCGGMKVVRGQEGIESIPTPKDSTVNKAGFVVYPAFKETLPTGEVVETAYGHDKDGQWVQRRRWSDGGYTYLGGYNDDGQFRKDGDISYHPSSEIARYFESPLARMVKYLKPESKEDGGVVMGQNGLITNLNPSDRNNRAKRWTRREALDVAQAGNEDAPSRGTLRKEYRQLKREGLENGLGWRARRDDARRRLVGGYNLNGEFQSTTPELILPSFEGPRKYTEGIITTEGPTVTEVIATKRSPRTITPMPQQEGPSITDSLAAQKAFNDAWMQYQYERGIYNNRTGAYTAGQDGQAYMNWMYGDFKKNYDPTTGKMNSNWYWRQPTNEELKIYGAVLPGSAQARREYGIDLDNYRFLTPETMLVQADPYELSAEQRRDVAKYPTTIGPGSNDIHGNIGKLMGSLIGITVGADIANQMIASAPEMWEAAKQGSQRAIQYFKNLATQQARGAWNGNTAQARVNTWNSRTPYGIRSNATGQFSNPGNMGRFTSGTDFAGTFENVASSLQFKQGGQIEKPIINRFKNVLHK